MTHPAVGSPAPDFDLRDQHGVSTTLSSYTGRAGVLLVFFPFAFSRVCGSELAALRDGFAALDRPGLAVLAVSCDPVHTLRAYAEAEALPFPLLSDFWPHGTAARAFGAFDEDRGCAGRSSYLVDLEGTVRWQVHRAMGEPRRLTDYAEAVHGSLG